MPLKGFSEESPFAFRSEIDPAVVSQKEIEELVIAARGTSTGRSRLLLHADSESILQEMVIALPSDSCDHPHIKYKSGKTFLALSGRFAVMCCSDDGTEISAHVLTAGAWPGARLCHLRAPVWHTIIPLAGDTVFLETIIGPFTGNRFANWFPDRSDADAHLGFVEKLRRIAKTAAAALP
jgi:cupin fold WbuC family metalloprotein